MYKKKKGKLTQNIPLQPVIKMMSMNQAESSVLWPGMKEERLSLLRNMAFIEIPTLTEPRGPSALLKAMLLCLTAHIPEHRKDVSRLRTHFWRRMK